MDSRFGNTLHRMMFAVFALTACCFALVICGCSSQQPAPDDTEQTRTFTDSANRTVELPNEALERVAVANESAQEFVLTLAPDKLVGLASAISDEQAAFVGEQYGKLPVYGELEGDEAVFNKELLESLKPQVIIDVQPASEDCAAHMDKLQKQTGVACVHIDAQLDSLDRAYTLLGDLLTCDDRAQELATYCQEVYKSCQQSVNAASGQDRPRVAYLLSRTADKTMPQGSAQGAVVDAVCDNIMRLDTQKLDDSGKQTSPEQVALWDPDIILFSSSTAYETLPSSDVWSSMSAIKKKAYYQVPRLPYNWLSSPIGPNQLLGYQWLTYVCYGQDLDMNLRSCVTDGFETLYGHKLTKDEYKALVKNSLPAK